MPLEQKKFKFLFRSPFSHHLHNSLDVPIVNNLGCVCIPIIYKCFYYIWALYVSVPWKQLLSYVRFHPQSTDQFIKNKPENPTLTKVKSLLTVLKLEITWPLRCFILSLKSNHSTLGESSWLLVSIPCVNMAEKEECASPSSLIPR